MLAAQADSDKNRLSLYNITQSANTYKYNYNPFSGGVRRLKVVI